MDNNEVYLNGVRLNHLNDVIVTREYGGCDPREPWRRQSAGASVTIKAVCTDEQLEEIYNHMNRKEQDLTMARQYQDNETTAHDGYQPSASRLLREAAMTEGERLLRKYDIVDSEGSLTHEGRNVLLDMLFEENRDEVISRLKELEKKAEK